MKHGVRLTRKQKVFLKSKHLIPDHWLCIKNTSAEVQIINKKSGKVKDFIKKA
jgi:hypothetical protein